MELIITILDADRAKVKAPAGYKIYDTRVNRRYSTVICKQMDLRFFCAVEQ